jgi:hypothetical protein
MDEEAAALRRELSRVEKGRGQRYPEQLRRRVMVWAAGRRAAGASWEQIKRELGQRFDTVRRWCVTEASSSPRSRALVPVRVVDDAPVARTVAVVSPAGFRVDGLTLSEAAALLRELT